MVESRKSLSPVARSSLVVGLWVVLLGLLALAVRNIGWVATWAHGVLFGCLLVFGVVLVFSLVAAAVHLSVDTIKGRYPYSPSDMPPPKSMPLYTSLSKARTISPATTQIKGKPFYRKALEVVGVLVITGAMTLILLEIGLRLFAPQSGPEMRNATLLTLYTPDPVVGYRNASNANTTFRLDESTTQLTTNSQGLREDHEISIPAQDSVRLLCMGDSFTFGYGVEAAQAYPQLLNGIPAANGGHIESINTGVNGYGTDNEAAWLHTYGWAYQPKIIVVGFYVGNDVRDVMLGMGKAILDDQGHLVVVQATRPILTTLKQLTTADGPVSTVKLWLARNSHAYVFLRGLAHGIFDPIAPAPTKQPTAYDTAPFYYKEAPADIEAGWDKATSLLDDMRAEAHAHGAELVVAAIPTREQIESSYWEEMKARFGLSEDSLERDRPQRKLAEWSARTHAPLIDLLPDFRAAQGGPFYFRRDPHWNAAGHALAAQLIHDGLARLGLAR